MATDIKGRVRLYDQDEYETAVALTPAQNRPRPVTHSRPRAFVVTGSRVKGSVFWLKAHADNQGGLVAELVGARLAHRLVVGPQGLAVWVDQASCPPGQDVDHLAGKWVFGSREVPNTVNVKEIQTQLGLANLPTTSVNMSSWARVATYQSWLGLGDAQGLLDLGNGSLYSVDHGAAFMNLAPSKPSPIVPGLPGLKLDAAGQRAAVMETVDRIVALNDDDIARSVAGIPDDQAWNASLDRRSQIAEWLVDRRDNLRGVMDQWTKQ